MRRLLLLGSAVLVAAPAALLAPAAHASTNGVTCALTGTATFTGTTYAFAGTLSGCASSTSKNPASAMALDGSRVAASGTTQGQPCAAWSSTSGSTGEFAWSDGSSTPIQYLNAGGAATQAAFQGFTQPGDGGGPGSYGDQFGSEQIVGSFTLADPTVCAGGPIAAVPIAGSIAVGSPT
jgi:hypothetical protein